MLALVWLEEGYQDLGMSVTFVSQCKKGALVQTEQKDSVTFTFQPCQRVIAALLVAGKEAVTVEEVGPGHFDGLKGMDAVFPQCLACAAAWFDHLVILAGRGEHRAAYETYLRGALSIEQAVDDTQKEVLCP